MSSSQSLLLSKYRFLKQSKRTRKRQILRAISLALGQPVCNPNPTPPRATPPSISLPCLPSRVLRSFEKFQPVIPDKEITQDSYAFELEFIRVAVKRGLGRETLNELVSVLNKYNKGCFPKDARACVGSLRSVPVSTVSPGIYHHFGLENCISRALRYVSLNAGELCLQFNVDGLPISRSSTLSFWPILARVTCQNFVSRVLLVGLYCGDKKPDSIATFLNEFLVELRQLLLSGITVGEREFVLRLHSFVCDAPARQFLKCIKSHNAYSACERCTIEGSHDGNSVRFPSNPGELIVQRSDAAFRSHQDPGHHISGAVSPLCDLPIDMVRDFPLDYMHLVLLGVVKKLLRYWLGFQTKITPHSRIHKLSTAKKAILNVRALRIGATVTVEFQRKPRTFTYIGMFKATEYRSFVCYTGPYILFNVFESCVVFNHFMCLVVAMRILLTPNQPDSVVDFAGNCLEAFVSRTQNIYGSGAMVYNMHGLLHLVSDYKRFGSLDKISSFPYESYLCKLKSYITRPGKQLQQVVKRIHEQSNFEVPPAVSDSFAVLDYEHQNGPLGPYSDHSDVKQYKQVRFEGKMYRVNSSNDVLHCDVGFCRVVNIVKIGLHVALLVRSFSDVSDVFTYPCKSSCVGVAFVGALNDEIINVHVREATKCWHCKFDDTRDYVVKLLHESR